MADDLLFPAWVQAVSAGLIASLTIFLVVWTIKYARAMHRANKLQAESNRIASAALASAQSQTAPAWRVYQDGRSTRHEGYMTAPFKVENLGGGLGRQVVVVTDWGDCEAIDFVEPSGLRETEVRIARSEWRKGIDPVAERVRWNDAQGRQHDESL